MLRVSLSLLSSPDLTSTLIPSSPLFSKTSISISYNPMTIQVNHRREIKNRFFLDYSSNLIVLSLFHKVLVFYIRFFLHFLSFYLFMLFFFGTLLYTVFSKFTFFERLCHSASLFGVFSLMVVVYGILSTLHFFWGGMYIFFEGLFDGD